jgi:selenocysteine-specific elongation factor
MEFTKNTLNIAGSITIGELRDKFQTSRKYALAFLEHLDTIGITILKEEKHILKQV